MVYTSAIFIYIKSLVASRSHHRFREDIIVLKSTSYCFGVTCQCGVSPSVYKTQGAIVCAIYVSTDIISTIVFT